MDKLVTSMMRRCGLILGKLMKHKHGWVFNTPVDVVGLGLHDYHQIIKQPMDLGTVKSRLSKMDQMLEIIKKRNSHMAQEGDEIELDIEALDNETLWELDRFVSNHKKAESKMKRQGLMNNVVLTAPIAAPINKSPVREPTPEAVGGQKSRKGDAGEEDVDIGEEIPINNFPPVEIEKDVANGSSRSSSSSSSSSSSDSSSSSGSDSASSSGSDSDEDSVQSPFVESKEAS
ncbi:hypothetical protein CsSME_00003485 [Camellia sinensis var. sinensis]